MFYCSGQTGAFLLKVFWCMIRAEGITAIVPRGLLVPHPTSAPSRALPVSSTPQKCMKSSKDLEAWITHHKVAVSYTQPNILALPLPSNFCFPSKTIISKQNCFFEAPRDLFFALAPVVLLEFFFKGNIHI